MRLCLCLWGAVLVLGACGSNQDAPEREVIRPAKLATVSADTRSRTLTFPAVIRAAQSAELTFQRAGEIRELLVLEGATVEEGDIIARLDQRDVRNQLAQAQAEFENAQAEYNRAENLAAQDAISRSTLDSRRTQLDVAQASLDNARKALDDTVLRAPFSGGVSRVYSEQFQNIQAKEPIALIQSSDVEAVMNAPGTIVAIMPQLQSSDPVVILDAAPDLRIPASLKEASGEADTSTQTYEVSFTFEPPEDLLILPGMTATLSSSFQFTGSNDAVPEGLSIPLSAVLYEGGQTYAWVVEPGDGRVTKQPIRIEATNIDSVIVVGGLKGGETIVTAGTPFLHEGMKVRAWQPD